VRDGVDREVGASHEATVARARNGGLLPGGSRKGVLRTLLDRQTVEH
jgi:hypothetical protein